MKVTNYTLRYYFDNSTDSYDLLFHKVCKTYPKAGMGAMSSLLIGLLFVITLVLDVIFRFTIKSLLTNLDCRSSIDILLASLSFWFDTYIQSVAIKIKRHYFNSIYPVEKDTALV